MAGAGSGVPDVDPAGVWGGGGVGLVVGGCPAGLVGRQEGT